MHINLTCDYSMLTFKVFVGICNEMDEILRRFWWTSNPKKDKYMALTAWDRMCKPKIEGME